jgi:hypothetical protein
MRLLSLEMRKSSVAGDAAWPDLLTFLDIAKGNLKQPRPVET